MMTLDIAGVKELGDALKKIGVRLRADICREALITAATPVVNSAQRHAARDTGALQESIGFRFKKYQGGAANHVSIGPRRGFKGPDMRDPVKYAHLVEFGHYTRFKAGKGGGGAEKGVKITEDNATAYILARPFMRPAWQENKDALLKTVGDVVGRRVGEEAERNAWRGAGRSTPLYI